MKTYAVLHIYLCCKVGGFWEFCWKCCSNMGKGSGIKRDEGEKGRVGIN